MSESTHAIDLGPNAKALLEQLARTIGVTVEKVFPWYVQYVQTSSLISVLGEVMLLTASPWLWWIMWKRTERWSEDDRQFVRVGCSAIAGFIVILGFFGLLMDLPTVLVPEPNAIDALMKAVKP